VIVAEGNFHGRTITMVSLSTDPSSYRGYGPPTPGFVKVPFGDAEAIERAIDERTAGVLIEPIQGEAGVLIPPDGYLRRVREICTRRGVALCFDEIQTGLGRTGRMFAWQHEDARPDAITLGKGRRPLRPRRRLRRRPRQPGRGQPRGPRWPSPRSATSAAPASTSAASRRSSW
jgi:ornithine--oxo-acid transaminase